MRIEDVNARKAYIQNVRKSFDSPDRKYEFEQEADKKGEAEGGFSFFKVRLCIAALLFAAYVFCDKTNTTFYNFTAKEAAKKITQTFDYDSARDEILQVFHIIQTDKREY